MSKNDIVREVFVSKGFADCINKMEPAHLREDLKAEVVLTLLEKSEDFLRELHENGTILNYANGVVYKMLMNKTSNFFKSYRRKFIELENVPPDFIQVSEDKLFDKYHTCVKL